MVNLRHSTSVYRLDTVSYTHLDVYKRQSHTLLDGGYKLGGWYFDLRPYCKKYWIKLRDGGIFEGYAPNKTCIRKVYGDYWVDQIVEVKERRASYVPRYAHV